METCGRIVSPPARVSVIETRQHTNPFGPSGNEVKENAVWQGGGIGECVREAPRTLDLRGPTSHVQTGQQYFQDPNLDTCSCTILPSRRPNREEKEGRFRSHEQGPIHKYSPMYSTDQQEWNVKTPKVLGQWKMSWPDITGFPKRRGKSGMNG